MGTGVEEIKLDQNEVRQELMNFFIVARRAVDFAEESGDVVPDAFDFRAGISLWRESRLEMVNRNTLASKFAQCVKRACFAFCGLSYRCSETVDVAAEVGLGQGRPAIADDFPEICVAVGLADDERALDLKAEATEFAVSHFEVDNYIVQGLAEVALLKSDTANCTMFGTRSVAFGEQVREV